MADQPAEEGSGIVERRTVDTSTGPNGASERTGGDPEQLEVHNPATGELIATVSVDAPQAVAETSSRLRANQPAWESLGIEGRYRWLGRLR
ncbi:MAG TPA: hypothetical protein VFZ41_09875, partial [Solirubrobacterales bacterium]